VVLTAKSAHFGGPLKSLKIYNDDHRTPSIKKQTGGAIAITIHASSYTKSKLGWSQWLPTGPTTRNGFAIYIETATWALSDDTNQALVVVAVVAMVAC